MHLTGTADPCCPRHPSLNVPLFFAFLVLHLLPQLDVLFVLSEDVVFLRKTPLETFLDSDKSLNITD
jgi:hypothetical protein